MLPPRSRNRTVSREEYTKFLLADFSSLKVEIARRSTLQRFVLVGFGAVLAVTFQQGAPDGISLRWVVGLWISSTLFLQFYVREHLEIQRLGTVIREEIATVAGLVVGVSQKDVFHSETLIGEGCINSKTREYDKKFRRFTQPYDSQFNWIVFLILPSVLTSNSSDLFSITTYGGMVLFLLAFVAFLRCGTLLLRHAWPIWYRPPSRQRKCSLS